MWLQSLTRTRTVAARLRIHNLDVLLVHVRQQKLALAMKSIETRVDPIPVMGSLLDLPTNLKRRQNANASPHHLRMATFGMFLIWAMTLMRTLHHFERIETLVNVVKARLPMLH